MAKSIPYARQNVTEGDIAAVVEVLNSDYLTQGPVVDQFENQVSLAIGAKYAIAVSSATAGLHLACLALGLDKGDYLWTSPITFVASANCGVYCGASVDFVDVDSKTLNICPKALGQKLKKAARDHTLPSVLVVVHMAGQSPDMQRIRALGEKYNFKIIEDASHAMGGYHCGSKVGICEYSDVAVFSFHPVKIVTAGEGGVITTNQSDICDRLKRLRSHGIERSDFVYHKVDNGAWYYEQLELGYNYRLSDIHAALGLSQLKRLKEIVLRRNAIRKIYDKLLANMPLATPVVDKKNDSSCHLYIIQLADENKRKAVFEYLRSNGILVNVHYIPVHLQPFYKARGFVNGDFPVAENYYKRAITLPLYPELTDEECIFIAEHLKKSLKI